MKTKKESRLSVFFSTAAHYAIRVRREKESTLERIGARIGSKLPLLLSLPRSTVTLSEESWGKAICTHILPVLGYSGATYGISKYSKRLVVKIPKKWESEDPSLCLPVIPAVIERVFAGWFVPVSVEVQADKSILLVVAPKPTPVCAPITNHP
ncbi:hypothetical protein NECID01_0159 [Nematocida sp. AWRm77]|nr:hypothetical protein NECID01_0159 [Nematocida sp. AWRm77]